MLSTPTYQSKEVRDFLRLYGPYVAEQIDVWCPGRNRFGRLCGLPYVQNAEAPFADVLLYATAEERREEILVDAPEAITNLRPVLYGFEDLASEIVLADGRRVVPAVEVAKLLAATNEYGKILLSGKTKCYLQNGGHGGPAVQLQIWGENTVAPFLTMEASGAFHCIVSLDYEAVIAKLRELHVAVGLRPEQYRRKAVGAASPCAAGCAGCDKGEEVGRG